MQVDHRLSRSVLLHPEFAVRIADRMSKETFANGVTDPTKLVADSIKYQKPMVFVSINYRLNIFAFGDGKEKNLALKDQRLGIEWVRKNIASFGGDPVSSTIVSKACFKLFSS